MPETSAPAQRRRTNPMVDLAYIAVFTALIIVLGFLAIPVGSAGVPIVLQNAAIILAGLVLGGRRGLLTGLLFLGLGLIGIPVLPGGRTTLSAMAGPTAGYLIGYVIAAFVAGLIAYRARPRDRRSQIPLFIIASVVGLLIQYVAGALGLVAMADMTVSSAAAAQLPFILPDTAKMVFMIIIALGVHAAFPDLLERK